MLLALAAILCVGCGFALASAGWPARLLRSADLYLRASLSVPFGLAIFSVVFFLTRVLGLSNLLLADLAVFGLLLTGLALRLHWSGRFGFIGGVTKTEVEPQGLKPSGIGGGASSNRTARSEATNEDRHPGWISGALTAGFVASIGVALYSAGMRLFAHPHGNGWDAFAIWNLHARFLYRGGAHWRDGFSPAISWSHPDYPLLLPAAVAHFWSYVGHDDAAVPAVIAFLFTFCTVGLLCFGISALRGHTAAMLGGMALLSTPAFIDVGSWQYADVPLSFFFLATVVLLCFWDAADSSARSGFLALAGVSAGCAAWTKNEGLLFLCVMVSVLVWSVRRERRRGVMEKNPGGAGISSLPFLATIVPAVVLIMYFKHSVAPPGDLFTDRATMLHKLMDPARYWAVIKWFGMEFLRFGSWWAIPGTVLLAGLYLAVGKEYRGHQPGFRAGYVALVLTLAGYFAVYLITPLDLNWHLRFSLGRLFLQVWPSALFLFFVGARIGSPSTVSQAG